MGPSFSISSTLTDSGRPGFQGEVLPLCNDLHTDNHWPQCVADSADMGGGGRPSDGSQENVLELPEHPCTFIDYFADPMTSTDTP